MRPEPDIALPGVGALHRVDESDRDTVRAWRNAPGVRAAMYTTHEISEAEHAAWWAGMMADPARRYYIAQGPDAPLGVIGFTQMDAQAGAAQWALYGAPGAPRGAGARMGALSMELAFGRWALTRLVCEVRAENARARALYDRLGFSRLQAIERSARGGPAPALRLELPAQVWQDRRAAMLGALAAGGAA